MPNNIKIRIADSSDINALIKVGNTLFDNDVVENLAEQFFQDSRHMMTVASKDDSIVGFASGFVYVHPDKESTLFVNEVGVLEELQGKGIGQELVRELVEQARRSGCLSSWVATESSNIAARKAFCAAGGEETSTSVVLIEYNKKMADHSAERT